MSSKKSKRSKRKRSRKSKKRSKKSLYDRLGGIYNIALVINRFSDKLIKNKVVGINSTNPALRKWHRDQLDRLPGLKWMRTLWVADISGGPYKFIATKPGICPLSLENAHAKLKISSKEFDAVAKVLQKTLKYYKVPEREQKEVLEAFGMHKIDINYGYYKNKKNGKRSGKKSGGSIKRSIKKMCLIKY